MKKAEKEGGKIKQERSLVAAGTVTRKGREGEEEGRGDGRTGRRWTETEQKIEVHVT